MRNTHYMPIGGEFAIDNEWYEKVCFAEPCGYYMYSCGRSALYAILKDIFDIDTYRTPKHEIPDKATDITGRTDNDMKNKVLMPDYLCYSIVETVRAVGIAYEYYHVDIGMQPVFGDILSQYKNTKADAILLINYFGLIDNAETISEIRKTMPDIKIIVDCVQDYYGYLSIDDFDYAFTGLRKWFAVPDGASIKKRGSALKSSQEYNEDNGFSSYKLAGNLLKNYKDSISDEVFLELLEKGENQLNKDYLNKASVFSTKAVNEIDHDTIKKERTENGAYLHERLEKRGIRHIYSESGVPMFIPMLCKDRFTRDSLKQYLHSVGVYAPVHWPLPQKETKLINEIQTHNELYDTELSLICDQRYSTDDMEYIITCIDDYRGQWTL